MWEIVGSNITTQAIEEKARKAATMQKQLSDMRSRVALHKEADDAGSLELKIQKEQAMSKIKKVEKEVRAP